MARPLRVEFSGVLYHVTARGNGRLPIFIDDPDRERFLAVLAAVVARYQLLCHAYCLMGNHYHLLLETPEGNLSRAMRQLNGVYCQRFNWHHRRTGHVLEGRFHAQVIDKEAYLRAVCRYVVLNPVRAGLASHPGQWPWSSYRATAGEGAVPAFLSVDWVLALGDMPLRADAERRYRQFVAAGLAATGTRMDHMSWRITHGPRSARANVARPSVVALCPRIKMMMPIISVTDDHTYPNGRFRPRTIPTSQVTTILCACVASGGTSLTVHGIEWRLPYSHPSSFRAGRTIESV